MHFGASLELKTPMVITHGALENSKETKKLVLKREKDSLQNFHSDRLKLIQQLF